MLVVIPAAGDGQRFKDAGYTKPKPLIDVCGKPMIERALDGLTTKSDKVIIISRQDIYGYDTKILDHKTEGAVCTVLEAPITDDQLLIANCDQIIDGKAVRAFKFMMEGYDAGAMTFNSTNPHHSYMKVHKGEVVEVAEKKVISDHAIVGVYWFKNGLEFVKYANRMIEKDMRHNGEFYISPVFNEYIADGKKVGMFEIDTNLKHILGTPEELQIYIDKVEDGICEL